MAQITVGLNPYCSGRWSRTHGNLTSILKMTCLNPYCSGRWSRTVFKKADESGNPES